MREVGSIRRSAGSRAPILDCVRRARRGQMSTARTGMTTGTEARASGSRHGRVPACRAGLGARAAPAPVAGLGAQRPAAAGGDRRRSRRPRPGCRLRRDRVAAGPERVGRTGRGGDGDRHRRGDARRRRPVRDRGGPAERRPGEGRSFRQRARAGLVRPRARPLRDHAPGTRPRADGDVPPPRASRRDDRARGSRRGLLALQSAGARPGAADRADRWRRFG